MQHVRWIAPPESVDLTAPVVALGFTGWNDAGRAASTALAALIASSQATLIAEIDPEVFTDFGTVRPEVRIEGGKRTLVWPTVQIYAARLPGTDALLVLGPEPSLRWRAFSESLVETFECFGVELVVALGALLAEVPHTRPTQVIGVSADAATMDRFDLEESHYEGPTGIVGVIVAAAADAGIPAASLWAAVPSYTAEVASPAAAAALVERASEIIGTPPPSIDLDAQLQTFERHVADLISDDEDLGLYVSRLESIADAEAEEFGEYAADTFGLDETTGATIAAEVEEFLRDHGGG